MLTEAISQSPSEEDKTKLQSTISIEFSTMSTEQNIFRFKIASRNITSKEYGLFMKIKCLENGTNPLLARIANTEQMQEFCTTVHT